MKLDEFVKLNEFVKEAHLEIERFAAEMKKDKVVAKSYLPETNWWAKLMAYLLIRSAGTPEPPK